MKTVMPLLKDKVPCQIGMFFGNTQYNDYVVTENDFEIIKEFFAMKILK